MRAQRNFLIIAGALLISPLVAFRSPTSHAVPSLTLLNSVVSREDEHVSVAESHNYLDAKLKSSSVVFKPTIVGNSTTGKRRNADSAVARKRTVTLLNITSDGFSNVPKRRGQLKIDKKTFDWLIGTWAYSKQSDSVDMAIKLLQRMEQLHSQGNIKLAPDSKTYTNAIKVIAYSGQPDAGVRAEKMLDTMINRNLSPNTMTYTYVIDAYSRSSSQEAPHHAQRLVEAMETARLQGHNVKPTARAWNSVIKAWSAVSASKASACLDAMEKLADATGNEEVRPNSYNVNSVINAWAKSGDARSAKKAELVLQKLERMYRDTGDERFRPRTETYNAIIDSYSKSGEADAPHRAELLLGYMMELYETGNNEAVKPNVRSFNSIMNVYAKSGDLYAPERAADILKKMEELAESGLQVAPDATSFATVINAYARSLNYGKADAAYKLFQKLDRLYDLTGNEALRPNTIVINSVLNACAFTIGDIEEQCRAIEIANQMFTAISRSDDDHPDEVTYGSFLKVICNQMPPGKQRNKVVHVIFQKAVSAGLVGHLVLKQIKEVGLDDVTQKMYFGTQSLDSVRLEDLPSSWTNNVTVGRNR